MIEKGNTVNESKNCGNCCHAYNWQGNPEDVREKTGECRRGPPTVIAIGGPAGQIRMMAVFPPVVASLFCDEFRKKLDSLPDQACEESMSGAGEIIASQ